MLEQYKRTFWGTQVFVGLMTVWLYFTCQRQIVPTAFCFLAMQIGGVLGAGWASRLRRKTQQNLT